MHEKVLAWKSELETERATLLDLQGSGDFTEEHAGRLNNIESMLDQIVVNQHFW
ncbi:hypothetical protein [Bacillus sp. Marseille-P3661]|uniref:hypothetical protein n=1 Tax=Bacillus sp. Marseille-P3661 TaxID=1936234 RepID=UPI0015E18568|nr:hypothetical protein [Bacillus sp. Marseille-P3661]